MNCPVCGCDVPPDRSETELKAIREAVPFVIVKTLDGDYAVPDRTAAQRREERR